MESPHLGLTLVYIAVSLAFVFLNGFFVAAEFSIVKVRRTRLEELAGKGVPAARASIRCVDELDEYLSATQLGITMVSLGLGWIGEDAFFRLFSAIFPQLREHGGNATFHVLATAASFFMITMLHVVLGELVPKSMAIQKAETVALKIALPLRWFYAIARPMIHAFTWLARAVLKVLGFDGSEEPPLSEEELKIVMKESHDEGVISESEAQIITRAFSFSDKRVGEIMIPAEEVRYLSLGRSFAQNLAVSREKMHSRLPLARAGFDQIIGIVHLKDVMQWQNLLPRARETNDVFVRVVRPALYVDPGLRQDRLMRIFKERRAHLAVIRDPRTRRNLGIVTLEDILEDLVGEIQDEHGN